MPRLPLKTLKTIPLLLVFLLGQLLHGSIESFALEERAPSGSLKILALGDSLTEGYGVPLSQAYPARLQEMLRKHFPESAESIQVVNAGVGGSTSASGPKRLRWHLRAKPHLILLALGANDMLRGISPEITERNLKETLQLAADNQIPVILAGMRVPPNYGSKYRRQFERLYPRLAREFKVPLIPFLLEGVAGFRDLNLEDGIHPNERGQEKIARLVEPIVSKWIRSYQKRGSP
ncbi:arylesterase [bacterium]|nr:arylesterase [bacterium]